MIYKKDNKKDNKIKKRNKKKIINFYFKVRLVR